MKTYIRSIAIVITTITFLGCAGSRVVADFDRAIDFKNYKTFTICQEDLSVQNLDYPGYDNELNRNRLKEATTKEMVSRGYVLNEEKPQLQAGFKLVIEDVEMMFTDCFDEEEIGYWQECKINTYNYTQQTLVMYVLDLEKNQIIWQGLMEGGLADSPKKMTKAINENVARIFKEYPI